MKKSKRPVGKPRKPAYRTKESPLWKKPLDFLHEKWLIFRGYSRRKQVTIVGGVLLAIMVVIPTASYLYFIRDINDPERLMNRNRTGIIITDSSDEVLYTFGRTRSEEFYSLDKISDNLEKALISGEDQNFYEHQGFSIRSIGGAFIANVLNKDLKKYGGSTITQQLVKNNLLTTDKSYLRKYQELSIAIAIERRYSKDEILEMYLNSVYFGEGAFGIGQAADIYFDKKPSELTVAESSVLVGLLPAPSAYSPISGDKELSKREQERVLTKMYENGHITAKEVQQNLKAKLSFAELAVEEHPYAKHFTEMVLDELYERYGEEEVNRGGFVVRTTLDLDSQKYAEQVVKEQIASIRHLGATNGSVIAIDPKTSEVRVLVGSVDWKNKKYGQVNMGTTPRQPGSSFKPIYYTEALDKKLITPATVLKDEKRVFADGYTPENYDFRFRGEVTTRYALALSLNIPAIEVIEKVGVKHAAETAQRMGIKTVNEPEKYGLPLALGTAEATLLDMTNAYAAFANKGYYHEPVIISTIENKYGKRVFEHEVETKQVQSQQASYLISSILSDERARSALSGSALNIPGRSVAVKTGTTNDNVDAWTIGYTPSLAIGAWVGDNQHKPMQIAGTGAAGPIWKRLMENMLDGTQKEEFQRPAEITERRICGPNGTYDEVFISGTEPAGCNQPTQEELEAIRRQEEEEKRRREQEKKEQEKKKQEEQSQEPDPTEEETQPPEDTPNDDGAPTDGGGTDGGAEEGGILGESTTVVD